MSLPTLLLQSDASYRNSLTSATAESRRCLDMYERTGVCVCVCVHIWPGARTWLSYEKEKKERERRESSWPRPHLNVHMAEICITLHRSSLFFLPSLPERRRKKKPSARVERTVDCNKSNIGRPAPGRRHTGVAADGRRYNKRAPPTTCLICLDVINHIFIYLERPPRIDGWGLAGRQSFVKKISMRFSIGQREIKKINNKSSRGKKKKKEYAKDNNKTTEHSSSIEPIQRADCCRCCPLGAHQQIRDSKPQASSKYYVLWYAPSHSLSLPTPMLRCVCAIIPTACKTARL